jgi:hypothetical protein
MPFIEWLRNYRIELNTILAQTKAELFWNWIKWKIYQVWPNRDYNRATTIDWNSIMTPTMKSFTNWYMQEQVKPVISAKVEEYKKTLSKVKGFIDDVYAEEEQINNDLTNILQKNEQMQKTDIALKSIMKVDRSNKQSS